MIFVPAQQFLPSQELPCFLHHLVCPWYDSPFSSLVLCSSQTSEGKVPIFFSLFFVSFFFLSRSFIFCVCMYVWGCTSAVGLLSCVEWSRQSRPGSRDERCNVYVAKISDRVSTRELEDLFARYGRIRDIHIKSVRAPLFTPWPFRHLLLCAARARDDVDARLFILFHTGTLPISPIPSRQDFGFVLFEDDRDAADAIYALDGYELDGKRLIVELKKGATRGRERDRYEDRDRRRDEKGAGRCFNCGKDGHWARDCKDGDWAYVMIFILHIFFQFFSFTNLSHS
jgi:hypothetical protein